ncbi:MAG: hypothetical protein IJ542_04060 [Clostridia bacterium]|nr:hypothetical protein [Clostridia bacterium]
MKKKNIVGISIALGVLVALVLVVTMVFTLHTIDFQLTTTYLSSSRSRLFNHGTISTATLESQMKNDANFNKGGNLLFMSFGKNIENIEKKNPYVKIEKIVRNFPNRITVYYSEREPVALIKEQGSTNGYFVVDNELKILDYVLEDQTEYDLPIINNYDDAYKVQTGDFLSDSELKSKVQTFVSAAYSAHVANGGSRNALYEDILKDCISIEYYTAGEYDQRAKIKLATSNGYTITADVWRLNEHTFEKLSFLWNAYLDQSTGIKDEYTSDTDIEVYTNSTGEIELHVL